METLDYIDNTKNHDTAMNMLAEAGIYVLPCIAPYHDEESLDSSAYSSYRHDVLQSYFKSVDEMTKYSNTLGLVVSCGFINNASKTVAAPVIRAIVRDVKKYIRLIAKKKSLRALPVGICAPDERSLLKLQYDYFVSGSEKEAIDFFGFNDFSQAGSLPMQQSNYNELIAMFTSSPIPVFFSMYGNNAISPRPFHETNSLYCDFSMLSTFSGGFVLEFFQSSANFGLIERTESRRGNIRFTKLTDFRNLRDRLRGSFMRLPPIASVSPTTISAGIRPKMPKISEKWLAMQTIPKSPVQWFNVEEAIDDSEWVDLSKDVLDEAVEDLGSSFKERLNINDPS
ncbi:glycoside hydrolase family 72 protein [Annulohypoxylon truncatum]|uniref:glycoside hydrolase family 72 protein n=1 Tax=Annulohypoxylon truncatum TaxID=327061 RepID=UPI002008CFA9|nr:glycoside hydrolase family 72 protein [Annulohypoxylon truncatum]KAI1210795.1 glycoside hydrolase family 72 protein [Annulohypoxylon truncatum]